MALLYRMGFEKMYHKYDKYLLDVYCHISRKNKNKISIFMCKNTPFFNESSRN